MARMHRQQHTLSCIMRTPIDVADMTWMCCSLWGCMLVIGETESPGAFKVSNALGNGKRLLLVQNKAVYQQQQMQVR